MVSDKRIYVRPIARIASAAAMPALAVAGRGDLLFAAAELIERNGDGVRRRVVSAAELRVGQLAPPELLERVGGRRDPIAGLALDRPLIMGVVNVTPDSFSDGGRYLAPDAAIAHALRLEAEGADILDIGAESTRPGSEPVDLQEELRRVMPVIEALAPRAGPPVDRHAQGRGDAARRPSGRGPDQRCLGPDARPGACRSRPRRACWWC
jgi:dihydropteroate synthase